MHDDPFEVLRRLAGDPVPTDADRQRALARLEHAIRTETPRSRFRWLTPIAAAVALFVVMVGVMLVTRPTAVEAALGEIATAARLATPQEIPTGSFQNASPARPGTHRRNPVTVEVSPICPSQGGSCLRARTGARREALSGRTPRGRLMPLL